MSASALAIHGGPRAITGSYEQLFHWPIVTPEDEAAVLDVLRRGVMSGTDITLQFEQEFAAWQGRTYAVAHNTGTAALHAALFGCEVGVGDEIICPSLTYWASALQVFSLGATVVFAEIDPTTLCIDPNDIEHRITPRTKAIMVVHYMGHPADMDAILALAQRHNIKVIEDVSHAQGGRYKGRMLGTMGDVAGMSLMSGKSLAIGEAGMLVTDDRKIYERAIAFGHYERYNSTVNDPDLVAYRGLPLGGYKYRMHQMSSAVGRVQLKYYDQRCVEIRKAMNHFWDLLADVPGLQAHRVAASAEDNGEGSNMAGWYAPHGLYKPEELGGLSVTRFAEAVCAEGFGCTPGINKPLHTHPLLNTADVYGHDRPTRIAFSDRDLRQPPGSLPVSERIGHLTYSIPWFKHYEPTVIAEYANAFRKVAENYQELLASDPGNPAELGGWHFYQHG